MVLLFVVAPILQSCGSSRGCKKMRKYRRYTSCYNVLHYNVNITHNKGQSLNQLINTNHLNNKSYANYYSKSRTVCYLA